MPLWKCAECHHEYEGEASKCNWCGSEETPRLLEAKTSLERMLETWRNKDD
jgi:hypothetical protein